MEGMPVSGLACELGVSTVVASQPAQHTASTAPDLSPSSSCRIDRGLVLHPSQHSHVRPRAPPHDQHEHASSAAWLQSWIAGGALLLGGVCCKGRCGRRPWMAWAKHSTRQACITRATPPACTARWWALPVSCCIPSNPRAGQRRAELVPCRSPVRLVVGSMRPRACRFDRPREAGREWLWVGAADWVQRRPCRGSARHAQAVLHRLQAPTAPISYPSMPSGTSWWTTALPQHPGRRGVVPTLVPAGSTVSPYHEVGWYQALHPPGQAARWHQLSHST